jgi:hypothetical protein
MEGPSVARNTHCQHSSSPAVEFALWLARRLAAPGAAAVRLAGRHLPRRLPVPVDVLRHWQVAAWLGIAVMVTQLATLGGI